MLQPEVEEESEPLAPVDESSLSESDIARLQQEVNSLQQQFDVAVDEKHSLELELVSMKERLKAASDMIERSARPSNIINFRVDWLNMTYCPIQHAFM